MVLPELFHDPMSPFCRKVRVVLDELGVSFSLTREDASPQRDEFLALIPAGEVPVLINDSGSALADSQAIVEYLQDIHREPDPAWQESCGARGKPAVSSPGSTARCTRTSPA